MQLSQASVKSNLSSAALYSGHRDRIRQRFLLNGFDGMLPYEVMEALLMQVIPRRDVKPLAKQLIARYGGVAQVLEQPLDVLENTPGLGRVSAIGLKMFQAAAVYCLQEKFCQAGNLLDRPETTLNFIRMKMGALKHECCMAIFLDAHHQLIEFCKIAEGTVNYVYSYNRNIMELALTLHASGVIIVHNHPSGVCEPSDKDIESTVLLGVELERIGVNLLDHFIVSRDTHFSFAAAGLGLTSLPEVENEH